MFVGKHDVHQMHACQRTGGQLYGNDFRGDVRQLSIRLLQKQQRRLRFERMQRFKLQQMFVRRSRNVPPLPKRLDFGCRKMRLQKFTLRKRQMVARRLFLIYFAQRQGGFFRPVFVFLLVILRQMPYTLYPLKISR